MPYSKAMTGLRVAIYARYSSDRQRDASVEEQVAACTSWATVRGVAIDPALVFTDRAESGTTMMRPAFARLRDEALARPRRIDVILIEDTSRVSRAQADLQPFLRDLAYAGVRLVGILDGVDTGGSSVVAKTVVTMQGLQSELYVDMLREKTRRGLEGRARAGHSTGGLPLGYRSEAVADAAGRALGKRILIDEDRAKIVKKIFALYAGGLSHRGIAEQLNDQGVQPPRAHASRTSRGWAASAVRAILLNERYTGTWTWGTKEWRRDPATGRRVYRARLDGTVVREDRPDLRIIDVETWEAVSTRLSDVRELYTRRADGSPKGRASITQKPTRYLLSGLLVCDVCGAPMQIWGTSASGAYYRCNDAVKRGTCGAKYTIREDRARTAIIAAMRDRLSTPPALAHVRRVAAEALAEVASGATVETERAHQRLVKVRGQVAALVDRIADGLSSPAVEARLRELEQDAGALVREIAGLRDAGRVAGTLPPVEALVAAAWEWDANIEADPTGAREVLRGCLEGGVLRVHREDDGRIVARARWWPLGLVLASAAKRKTAAIPEEPPPFCTTSCGGRI